MEMKAETFSLLPKWVRVIAGLFLVTIIITNIVAFIYIFLFMIYYLIQILQR